MRTCDLPFRVTESDRICAANVWIAMARHDEGADKTLPVINTIAREAGVQWIAAIRNGFLICGERLKVFPPIYDVVHATEMSDPDKF